ncbi:MAG TPA: hypothetical protein VG737_16590, partial [Cyclobacteriaceae bacterium]|nr:hypothetical protein [Cyclobacteriaceae bacterium]
HVTGYAEREIEIGQKNFEIALCDGKIHLLNAGDSAGWQHGSRHNPQDEQELLGTLPNLKAWKQLHNSPE